MKRLLTITLALLLGSAVRAEDPPGERPPPVVPEITATDILSGNHDYKWSRIRATVRDVFQDEMDPDYHFFVLDCGGEPLYAPLCDNKASGETLKAMIGAEVEITGRPDPCIPRNRNQLGPTFSIQRLTDIRVISPAPTDPFAVPEIGDLTNFRPHEVPRLGKRRISGRVIAVWQNAHALLRTATERLVRLELASVHAPTFGDSVEAVGFPETDLRRINLTRVTWRPCPPVTISNDVPVTITARAILLDVDGKTRVRPEFHGKAVRLTGRLLGAPSVNGMTVFDGENEVRVDFSALPELRTQLKADCKVEVTGTCVLDIDGWRPNATFPRIHSFFIVVRTPADVCVLAAPPWWTAGKFLALIGLLAALLVAVLLWNFSLRVVAERRGRELLREQIASVRSALKVMERTRLAVELHDSIAQILTGISFEIKTAARLAQSNEPELLNHLGMASQRLKSCREELRNCLWDLRHQAIDEHDVSEAIRQTVAPHIGDARLMVRFNVPRSRLSDNTTHTLLRIARELASNAVRHGQANSIRIAGSLENGRLLMSVADNGCGFDPENCPGTDQGHFGLQGVRERIESLEGELKITSAPGKGTKITIVVLAPSPNESDKEQPT